MSPTPWPFDEIWFVDFEFHCPDGELPTPICLVAKEHASGRTLQIWEDELRRMEAPPYRVDSNVLFVAYYASAEIGCHLSLGWPIPVNILDLYVEFRNLTNGLPTPCGWGLLGALAHFGLDALGTQEKEDMRALAIRGGPWTTEERAALLKYCASDVEALSRLFPRMEPKPDLRRALLRGRYMAAAARMERTGVPIDQTLFRQIRYGWHAIRDHLIREIDRDYGVYDGSTFKLHRFEEWLSSHNIPWPHLASGTLALDEDTFRQMARGHPQIAPLRELRHALSQLRLSDLTVGADSRNRCLLSVFRSRTGRNQPSNSKFIFGPSVWLRGLIRPDPGWGLAYIDWSQQEFGIAAALSKDPSMIQAYCSGDPYLEFARQAGAVPEGATKNTHGTERELYKQCVLGVQYAMGAGTMSERIGKSVAHARELLQMHRRTYPVFWRWSDAAVDYAMLHGRIWTVFGWTIHPGPNVNPRTLRNFPMQANGAEMLRLACCFATEQGIRVCAPVHDALLIEAPTQDLDDVIHSTQDAMARASRAVLSGFEIRTDVSIIRYPDRYADGRGRSMWQTVLRLLSEIERQMA